MKYLARVLLLTLLACMTFSLRAAVAVPALESLDLTINPHDANYVLFTSNFFGGGCPLVAVGVTVGPSGIACTGPCRRLKAIFGCLPFQPVTPCLSEVSEASGGGVFCVCPVSASSCVEPVVISVAKFCPSCPCNPLTPVCVTPCPSHKGFNAHMIPVSYQPSLSFCKTTITDQCSFSVCAVQLCFPLIFCRRVPAFESATIDFSNIDPVQGSFSVGFVPAAGVPEIDARQAVAPGALVLGLLAVLESRRRRR